MKNVFIVAVVFGCLWFFSETSAGKITVNGGVDMMNKVSGGLDCTWSDIKTNQCSNATTAECTHVWTSDDDEETNPHKVWVDDGIMKDRCKYSMDELENEMCNGNVRTRPTSTCTEIGVGGEPPF